MSKRDLKKEHILDAGLEVMKARGYNGTSVKDIVDAAGVPKGSFYNYFDSKEAFAVEALERASAAGLAAAHEALTDSTVEPVSRLTRFFESWVSDCCAANFRVGCFLGNMCQEMADSSEAIRACVRRILRDHTGLIEAVLEEAREAGRVEPTLDTRSMAEFLFNAWEGAVMRMKAAECREPLDAFLQQLPRVLSARV